MLSYEKYDSKADLWSVGVLMYEMLFGIPPFQAANHIQLLKMINDSWENAMKLIFERKDLSDSCRNLMSKLLQKNPAQRIDFEELFSHPFLRDEPSSAEHKFLTIYPPLGRSLSNSSSISSFQGPLSQGLV